jgi:hypothetical protein
MTSFNYSRKTARRVRNIHLTEKGIALANRTTVVNIRKEPCEVYGGRPSWLGNPYEIGKHGTRDEVCDKYIALRQNDKEFLRRVREELPGKVLGCFCKPLRCHLDWVAQVANGGI